MAIEPHDPGYPWWVTSNPNNPHYGGGSPPEPERPRAEVVEPPAVVPAPHDATLPTETIEPNGPAVLIADEGHLPSVPNPEPVAAPVEPGEPGRLGS